FGVAAAISVRWVAAVTSVYVRLASAVSTSLTRLVRSIVIAASSLVLAVPSYATGLSLTGLTVIVTVATALFGSARPLVVPLSVRSEERRVGNVWVWLSVPLEWTEG